MTSWIRRTTQYVYDLTLFIRFSALCFTVILPLLGAATGSSRLTIYQVSGLVGVAVSFHIFAYVLNDVVDLPIDRTEALRALYPLVKGTVQPWQALIIVFIQIPLALALTYWMKASYLAYIALGAAFTFMAVYDIWGKRNPFPLLTDLIQGLGWASLAFYGAAVTQTSVRALTGMLLLFVVVFVMFINGVHGAVRDVANDLRQGACTTAIFLGVKLRDNNSIVLSFKFILYALTLQALLTGLILLPLVYNWFGYVSATRIIMTSIASIFILLSFVFLVGGALLRGNRSRMISAGTLHVVMLLNCLLLLFIPYLDPSLLSILLVAYAIPLCYTGIRKVRKSYLPEFGPN